MKRTGTAKRPLTRGQSLQDRIEADLLRRRSTVRVGPATGFGARGRQSNNDQDEAEQPYFLGMYLTTWCGPTSAPYTFP